jgi:hypothetical protein
MKMFAILGFALLATSAYAQTSTVCDVTLKTDVSMAGGVPIGNGSVNYYGLDSVAMADMEKSLNKIADTAKKNSNKGGPVSVRLDYVKTCDGQAPVAQSGAYSGLMFHGATDVLRGQYKEGEAVLKTIDQMEDKGHKGNPFKQ